jgi:alkanesulfonate monooxygenase SsuD/methylene tetrahydromethanopterin reductase-like flavin-dependent oxidoreductase (luciferase family)
MITMTYVPIANLAEANARIDEGAAEAGRSPDAIRRGYNIGGEIQSGEGRAGSIVNNALVGTAGFWADQLAELYTRHRMDTFLFWVNATAGDQVELFAREVVPAVMERIAASL